MSDVFLKPKFEGARFAGLMPVESLVELSAYRELVLEVARAIFYERNPERKRVPKGFAEALRLGIRKVEDGSAVPIIERLRPEPAPSETGLLVGLSDEEGFDHFDYFIEARDRINALVEHPSPQTASSFSERTIRHFNKFGATLGPDETVTLTVPNGSSPTYDLQTRKSIVLLRESTYEDRFEETGAIVEIDAEKMSFQFRLSDGRRVPGETSEDDFHIYSRLVIPDGGFPVRVSGTGMRDGSDNLVRITEVDELTPEQSAEQANALDIESRLETLAQLGEGWLDDDKGRPIAHDLIERVAAILQDMVDRFGTLRPYLYPTPDGGLQAEWSLPGAEVSVEFTSDGETAVFYALMTQTQTDREEEISTLRPDQAAVSLANLVARFVPASNASP